MTQTSSFPISSVPARSVEDSVSYPIIDDYILKRVEYRVQKLIDTFQMSDDRQEDLLQDLIVELLKAAKRFKQVGKATWRTYACRVLKVASRNIVQRECRRIHWETNSDVAKPDSSQGYRSLVKCDARDEYDDIKHAEMRMDLEVILKRLPWQQRRLAKLLKTCTPLEAADKLNVHPNSVYRMIEQMRECFKMHNFQNFL